MSFQPIRSGLEEIKYLPKRASTAISNAALLAPDGAGAVQPAVAATTKVIGASLRTVVSTDADYAQNTLIPYFEPTDTTEFLADVGTGTMTTALVGTYCDLKDSVSIDVTASAVKTVFLQAFVSATQAIVRLVPVV